MNVVLDTNVLVSGLLTPSGPCGQIIELMIEGEFGISVDDRIIEEYESVLRRPIFYRVAAHIDDNLDLLRLTAVHVVPMPLKIRLPDPSDLPFLEVAVVSDGILVTGNKKHFTAAGSEYRDRVKIVSPREFLDLLS